MIGFGYRYRLINWLAIYHFMSRIVDIVTGALFGKIGFLKGNACYLIRFLYQENFIWFDFP